MTAIAIGASGPCARRDSDLKIDDANTPPFIDAHTNKPGKGPDGEHVFLDGEEAIQKMTIGKGMKVELFASEKEFPELVNPVQMAFDTRGGCGWRPGRTIRTGSRRRRWTTSC